MQSKKHSFIETCVNAITGFLVAWVLCQLVIPMFDSKNFSYLDGLIITCIFTVVSMVRTYIYRRIFNKWTIIGGAEK